MSNNAPDYENDLVFPPKNKWPKIFSIISGIIMAFMVYILIQCIFE